MEPKKYKFSIKTGRNENVPHDFPLLTCEFTADSWEQAEQLSDNIYNVWLKSDFHASRPPLAYYKSNLENI